MNSDRAVAIVFAVVIVVVVAVIILSWANDTVVADECKALGYDTGYASFLRGPGVCTITTVEYVLLADLKEE